jgi:hypothetical protein
MSLGASTLTPSDQVKFLNKYDALEPDQKDCLDKLLASVSKEAFETCDTKACMEDKISEWIKRNVINAKNPNYCAAIVKHLGPLTIDATARNKRKSK